MVTAELAVVMPFGLAFAFMLLWLVSLGVTQVRLVDASREAARMVARGDSISVATSAARHEAPNDAKVTAKSTNGYVTVTVTSDSAIPIPLFAHIGARTLTATAVAADETQ